MRFHGLFLSIWLGTSCLTAADREGERLFALKVRGILNAKCLACHGEAGKKLKGDLDLSSRAAMLKGGESEEASLVPGKPLASPLYLAATREHEEDWSAMPPKENDKLTADQLALLKRWIDLGAPWPDAKTQARASLSRKDQENMIARSNRAFQTGTGPDPYPSPAPPRAAEGVSGWRS